MAKNVIMPVLGMNQDTAVLLAWLKQEGDRVVEGEPLMEVETDKATMELEAPATGTLVNVRAEAGEEVRVGSVIAVILFDGESAPAGTDAALPGNTVSPSPLHATNAAVHGAANVAAAGQHAGSASPDGHAASGGTRMRPPGPAAAGSGQAAESGVQATTPQTASVTRLTPASPKARSMAAERGLDVTAIHGTGPEGAVLATDVLHAAAAPTPQPAATAAPAAAATWGSFERDVAADALLSAVDKVRTARRRDTALSQIEGTDILARLVAAAWTAGPAHDDTGPLAVSRVANGAASTYLVPLDASVHGAVASRQAAEVHAADVDMQGAALALLDLVASRIATAAVPGTMPSGPPIGIVAGRPSPRSDGSVSFRLVVSFDPGRVDQLRAAVFFDRLLGLVEDPASLFLMR